MEAASLPTPADPDAARSREVPIGTLLFRAGLATADEIEDALREGMRSGDRVGEILVRRGVVGEHDVARLLAAQKGLEFESLDDFGPNPLLMPVLAADAALRHQALPVRRDNGVLTLAIADPTNEVAMRAVRNEIEGPVAFAVAPRSNLRSALVRAYGGDATEPALPDEPSAGVPTPAPVEAPAAESSAAPEAAPPGDRLRGVPLGSRILRAGLVDPEKLQEALREGVATGRRLGEILLERGWLAEHDLARVLAAQKNLPFVELRRYTPDERAVELIPEETAVRYRALVYGFDGGTPLVALADPTDDLAIGVVHAAVGPSARLAVATPSDIASALVRAYAATPLSERDEPSDPAQPDPEATEPAAVDAPAAMFTVSARLVDGDSVRLLEIADEVAARDFARELIVGSTGERGAAWPFADGRFIAPRAIASIDIAPIETVDAV